MYKYYLLYPYINAYMFTRCIIYTRYYNYDCNIAHPFCTFSQIYPIRRSLIIYHKLKKKLKLE